MTFRVLKFKPNQPAAAAGGRRRGAARRADAHRSPPWAPTTSWWWQQASARACSPSRSASELRRPAPPAAAHVRRVPEHGLGFDRGFSGKGTVHSFTVIHHPQFPGYEYPLIAIALIDLEEGTRLIVEPTWWAARPTTCTSA